MVDMSEKIDLKKLENKAWRTYISQDGLFDIFMGIMLLTLAIQAYFYNIWFTSFIFIGILVVTLGKIFITTPRIGLVEFGNKRMKRQLMMMIALLMVFLVMLSLYYLSQSGNGPAEIVNRIAFPAFIAAIFVIVAYYLNYPRLGIYGMLFAFTEVLRGLYDRPVRNVAVLAVGLLALTVGFYVLLTFIKKYPLPEKEVRFT
jgi:succinate dehydrogenase hydrophobic anchor subunit